MGMSNEDVDALEQIYVNNDEAAMTLASGGILEHEFKLLEEVGAGRFTELSYKRQDVSGQPVLFQQVLEKIKTTEAFRALGIKWP